MKAEKKHFTHSRRSFQFWIQYLFFLLAWAGGVAGAALLAYSICGSKSWNGRELLYPLIHWAHQNVLLLGIVLTLGGWLVISYFFIARPVRYLNELVNAAEKLEYERLAGVYKGKGYDEQTRMDIMYNDILMEVERWSEYVLVVSAVAHLCEPAVQCFLRGR